MGDGRWRLVLVDAAAWAALSVAVGFAASRVPDTALAQDSWLTRPRALEAGGRRWERLGVRRWKSSIPEAGAAFAGTSKARLGGRAGVDRQLLEGRRAEWVHWALLACGPAFAAWNPPALAAAMVAFGVAANAPCIVVVRYNRARLLRVAARRDGGRPVAVAGAGAG